MLALASDQEVPGRPFELLWFADRARYLVAGGRLEVEDLFSLLRMGVTRARLKGWLVRDMGVDERVLDDVHIPAQEDRPTIEVRRPRELVAGGRQPTPEELLGVRSGALKARRAGDQITVTTEGDRRVVFTVAEERHGWKAVRWDGEFPYRVVALRCGERAVSLTATLDEGLDPLAPGVRSQVAFDLRSDLISVD
jgi:hypothetical protein